MEKRNLPKMTYAGAGVNIDAAAEAKKRIRTLARGTFTPGVLTDIGSFGALFRLEKERYRDPLLVSSCDGVGTKLKIAFMTGRHNTVGYDLVSHCVSDILVQGARPLFFLDYIACGALEPGVVEQIVSGLARGCTEMHCALIGGETAEMPDFYPPGEYDLAGFIVGIVDREKLIDGSTIEPGDVLLGLASAGLHTNGYSLARRLFFDRLDLRPDDVIPELGISAADLLLAPHRSYLALLEPLLDNYPIKGIAHITGGGLTDNLPRILPSGTSAVMHPKTWPILPVFDYMQSKGNIEDSEMYRTFNMGIGMVLVVDRNHVSEVRQHLEACSEPCYEIGAIVAGNQTVIYG
jgi:phosphoribosylformylglycinamidine cyclo-ligase